MSKANPVYNSVLKNFFSTNDIKFSSTAQRMHFAALLYEAGWEVYDKTRTVANAQFPNLTVDVTAGRFAGAAGVVISGPIICIATAVLLFNGIPYLVQAIVNPEYAAVEKIIKLAGLK